ncbi:cytochrome c3 family protein [Paenibacillus wynnii]
MKCLSCHHPDGSNNRRMIRPWGNFPAVFFCKLMAA